MLTSIIAIFLLLLGSAALAALSRRSMSECIPFSLCTIAVWLYVFYCCSMVSVGMILLCLAILGLAGFCVVKKIRLMPVLTAADTAVYAGTCVLFLLCLSDNHVNLHDELRLWGAVPKAIHVSGLLQLGTGSPIFPEIQSYPPGLPLILVYFTAFSRTFSEGALYVGYACTGAGFLLGALRGWSWKNRTLLAPAAIVLLLTPCVFTSHFGDNGMYAMTLFVDPLLGILAGCAFSQAMERPFRDWFHSVFFTLTFTLLCLLKDTGVLFAAAALICTAAIGFRGSVRRFCLPLLGIGIGFGSWKLLLHVYDIHAIRQISLRWLLPEELQNILHALVSENMAAYKVPLGFLLSFVFLFCLMMVLLHLFCRIRGKTDRKALAVVSVGILISTAAFVYGYALLYGKTLESFARYMTTPLLCMATLFLLTLLPMCTDGPVAAFADRLAPKLKVLLTAAAIALGIGVFSLWVYIFPELGERAVMDQQARQISTAVRNDSAFSGSGRVYLVIAGDGIENSHRHHRIFFDMLSEDVNLWNRFGCTQVPAPGAENPALEWAEELRNGFDYVYLLSIEADFPAVFSQLSDEIPGENQLYRVTAADTPLGILLEAVN